MLIHQPFIHPITKKVYETSNGEKEGWLKKESAWFKFWNKRFCVLKGLNLFYAYGENNPPHGMVSLIQCQRIQRVDHLVMLLKSPKGLFRFRATSEQEFEEWFKLIDAIQYAYANGRLGIRLSYLQAWVEKEGIIRELTTTDVCERIVKPATKDKQSSYCELMLASDETAEYIGPSVAFISHAWKYRFLDVIEALLAYFSNDVDVFIWFDLFTNNQHKAPNLDFHWWSTTFKEAIASFGCTVMVLAPWNHPIPLQRGWCIWELYCTIQAKREGKCNFDIAMSPSSIRQFIEDVNQGAGDVVNKMLATIDTEKSECFIKADQERIHDAIRRTIGFNDLNKEIFEVMRDWIIEKYQDEVLRLLTKKEEEAALEDGKEYGNEVQSIRKQRKEEIEIKSLTSLHTLSLLFYHQGNYVKALQLSQQSYDKFHQLFGDYHPLTVICKYYLGCMYFMQGEYEQSYEILQDCYEKILQLSREGEEKEAGLHSILIDLLCVFAIVQQRRGITAVSWMYEMALRKSHELYGEHHQKTLTVIEAYAQFHDSQGDLENAIISMEDCLKQRQVLYGDNHPDTITSLARLAQMYQKLGKVDKALTSFESCLEKRRSLFGNDHPDTLESLRAVAIIYQQEGKDTKALPLLQESYETSKLLYGFDHPLTLGSLSILAILHAQQGDFSNAIRMSEEVFEAKKRVLGEDDPDTIASISQRAVIFRMRGDLAKALTLEEECFKQRVKVLGEDHQQTILSMFNVGRLYCDTGNFMAALSLLQQCLKKTIHEYGEDHPQTLTVMFVLGDLIKKTGGDLTIALQYYLTCYEKTRLLYGVKHLETMITACSLSEIYVIIGQRDKALTINEELYNTLMNEEEDLHPTTVEVLMSLGLNYLGLQEFSKALTLFERCYEIRKTSIGKDEQKTMIVLQNIALAHERLGHHDQAMQLYVQIYQNFHIKLGNQHPLTQSVIKNLANLNMMKENYMIAKDMYEELLQYSTTIVGDDHPQTITLYNDLGNVYLQLGEYKKSFTFLEKCFMKMKVSLGQYHPMVLGIERTMIVLYRRLGHYKQSKEMLLTFIEKLKALSMPPPPDQWMIVNQTLALTEECLGNYEVAKVLMTNNLQQMIGLIGSTDHPQVLTMIDDYVHVLISMKEFNQAFEQCLPCLPKMESMMGMDRECTLICRYHLGMIYVGLKNYDQALPLLKNCFDVGISKYGENHPSVLLFMYGLSLLYEEQDLLQDALSLYSKCLEKREKVLGDSHPDALMTKNAIARIDYKIGNIEKAEELSSQCVSEAKKVLGLAHPFTEEFILLNKEIEKMLGKEQGNEESAEEEEEQDEVEEKGEEV